MRVSAEIQKNDNAVIPSKPKDLKKPEGHEMEMASSVSSHGFNMNQMSNHPASRNYLQPKLHINAPNDRFEKEADQMADQVVNRTDVDRVKGGLPESRIQQKPLVKQISRVPLQAQRKCSQCEEEENKVLQRKSQKPGKASSNLSSRIQNSRGGGSRMDPSTNSLMSSQFGTDFSQVRIHADSNAAQMSQEINAKAFTVGQNIFFNKGEYNTSTKEGQRLLAHELTHVVQQEETHNTLQRQPMAEDEEKEPKDGDYTNHPFSPVDEHLAEDLDDFGNDDEDTTLFAQLNPEKKSKSKSKKKKKKKKKKITSIHVNLTTQMTTVTFDDGSTKDMKSSTGKGLTKNFQKNNPATDRCRNPGQGDSNCTPTGTFKIARQNGKLKKRGKGHKNGKGDAMAYYVEISGTGASGRGIGFHNSQIVNGTPMSHGCIRVSMADSKTINEGVTKKTVVTISGKAKIEADEKAKKKAAKAKKKKTSKSKKPSSTGKTHKVKEGDTLGEIAEKYGVSVSDLQEANQIKNPHLIKVGDVLNIP